MIANTFNEKHIQYEFVELIKDNIKNDIEVKGEKKMAMNDFEFGGFEFPDDVRKNMNKIHDTKDIVTKEENKNSSFGFNDNNNNKSTFGFGNSNDKSSLGFDNQEEKKKQENTNPNRKDETSHLNVMGNPSDFKKLKEDLVRSFENKMVEFETMFNNKIEVLSDVATSFDSLIKKLNASSTTYNEVNTLIEKLNKENNENILLVKKDIESRIDSISEFLKNESIKTDEFVNLHIGTKSSGTKNKTSNNNLNKEEYEEEEYEDDDDVNQTKNKKNSNNNRDYEEEEEYEDDDVFRKPKEDVATKKMGFVGRIFKKMGL